MRFLLILPLILIGCAPKLEANHDGSLSGIDPAFTPYYQAFQDAEKIKPEVSIGFVPQAANIAGRCVEYGDGYRDIEIDPAYWKELSDEGDEDAKIVLVFHELGHCVFNRMHNWQEYIEDGCPKSIMDYQDFDWCYSVHQADYLAELPHSEPGDHL